MWFLVTALSTTAVTAQAYCALRDPVRHIGGLYPKADHWQSLVCSINPNVRTQVARRLPFTLHARELGRHTIYLVLDASENFQGIVHSRSEASRWGMVELVWSLDATLQIEGLRFQRCRSPEKAAFFASPLFEQLCQDADFVTLRSWLTPDGKQLTEPAKPLAKGCEQLAILAVRSALKTIVTTEVGWNIELAPARLLATSRQAIHDATILELVEIPVDWNSAPRAVRRIIRARLGKPASTGKPPTPCGDTFWVDLEDEDDHARICVTTDLAGGVLRIDGGDGSPLRKLLIDTPGSPSALLTFLSSSR